MKTQNELMRNIFTRISFVLLAGTFALILPSCGSKTDNTVIAESLSFYNINGTQFNGTSENDTANRLLQTRCQDNNIMMLHYSDSVLQFGFPATMKVMNITHSGHLAYHECYIEASTSPTDTWISTGADSAQVIMMDPQKDFKVQNTQMQHFTSVPLNDFGTFHATVVIR